MEVNRMALEAGIVVKALQVMRDEGHLSDALLRKAVRSVAESDDERYHWVGVYLLNEADQELWLHNYVGPGTEHSKIPVGKGICGRAVAERTNLNVPDVSKEENYIACQMETQSELIVLIRAGDEIYGQIDIDSDDMDAFTEEDETSLMAIADKLAEQIAAERRKE
ncbi:MAG: GAF domain-containing protein [Gemmatimonadetes bacterium]|jgi:L-methionine (R)-S-oxide reductase|nr:GAF domain-containing protein [Gemmatimonadota bacterium]